MNFVLDFFVDKDTHPFDIAEMRLLFASSYHLYEKLQSHKSPTWREAREFVYDNGITGVHYTLRYNRLGKIDLTAGKYSYSGLCLEMDLPKPSFFGYEAMKVVEATMKSLNLLAACSSHIPEPPQRYNYDQLVGLWLRANEQEANEEAAGNNKYFYAEKNKLLYWWRYTMAHRELHTKMKKKNIAAPEVTILAEGETGKAVTVCEWRGTVKTVLPVTDYVFLERRKPESRRLSRPGQRKSGRVTPPSRKFEQGLAPFSDVLRAVRKYVVEVTEPLPYVVYSRSYAPAPMKQELQGIRLESPKRFNPVTPDSVIDIDIDTRKSSTAGG
jgi:hypothetical protein